MYGVSNSSNIVKHLEHILGEVNFWCMRFEGISPVCLISYVSYTLDSIAKTIQVNSKNFCLVYHIIV
jgi:hypothetical protein